MVAVWWNDLTEPGPRMLLLTDAVLMVNEALANAGAATLGVSLAMLTLGASLGITLDIWVESRACCFYTRESQVLTRTGADGTVEKWNK